MKIFTVNMEIEKIKELINDYEWIVDEPSPLYSQFILDCLYLLFLCETERNEVYLNSKSVESFKPDIEGLKEIITYKKNHHAFLARKVSEALQELVFYLEKEENYTPNDSLLKRANILR